MADWAKWQRNRKVKEVHHVTCHVVLKVLPCFKWLSLSVIPVYLMHVDLVGVVLFVERLKLA
jgi:hypothetical protein